MRLNAIITMLVVYAVFQFMSGCNSDSASAPGKEPGGDHDLVNPDADTEIETDPVDEGDPEADQDEDQTTETDGDPDIEEDDGEPDPDEDETDREPEEEAFCENGPDAACFTNAPAGVSGNCCVGDILAWCYPSVPTPPYCTTSTCQRDPDDPCEFGCVDLTLDGNAFCAEYPPDGDETDRIEEEEEDPDDENSCQNGPDAQCFANGPPGTSGNCCVGNYLAFCYPSVPAPPLCITSTCQRDPIENCESGCLDPTDDGHAYCDGLPADGDEEADPDEDSPEADPDEDLEIEEQDESPFEGDGDGEDLDTCPPDDFEPNDGIGLAPELPSGAFVDLTICSGDLDYFKVLANTGEEITVSISFSTLDGNLDLYLLDENRELIGISASLDNGIEEVSTVANYDGPYYALARSPESENVVYDLFVEVSAVPDGDEVEVDEAEPEPEIEEEAVCLNDGLEDNDTKETAVPVSGIMYSGLVICPGDEDYYSLELRNNEFAKIDLYFTHLEGNIDIYVWNPSGALFRYGASTDDNEHVEFWASDGVYIFKVFANGGAETIYDMKVTVTPSPLCQDDGYEENDVLEEAKAIGAGVHSGFFLCGLDLDWYAVTLTAGQAVKIDVLFSDEDGNIDAMLYGPSGEELDSGTTFNDNETLVGNLDSGGAAYLLVYAVSPMELDYELSVFISDEPICNDDYLEDNGSFETALELGNDVLFEDLMACTADMDWYSFNLQQESTFSGKVLYTAETDPLRVALYDNYDDPYQPLRWSVAIDGGRKCSLIIPYTGAFKLLVWNVRPLSIPQDQPYTLEVSVCSKDDQEPNENVYQSVPLPNNTTITRLPDLSICEGDEDWFAFQPPADPPDHIIAVGITFDQRRGDLDMYLTDGYGNHYAVAESRTNNEVIRYRVPNTSAYYLQIVGFNGDQNTYYMDYKVFWEPVDPEE